MAGLSVQFVGIAEVMRAFDNKDCVNWAVWQGKNLNFSYSGSKDDESRAELEEWLKMLTKRSAADDAERYVTQAVYTLKFYEDHKGKITAQTPENSAFNFRLSESGESRSLARVSGNGYDDRLLEEVRGLRTEITEIKKKVDTPAVVGAAGEERLETWEKILDHPITMGLVGKIFGIDVGSILAADAKLSGVPDDAGIDSVVSELQKYDPLLLQHLKKLLIIAEHQPSTFKMLLGMVDKM